MSEETEDEVEQMFEVPYHYRDEENTMRPLHEEWASGVIDDGREYRVLRSLMDTRILFEIEGVERDVVVDLYDLFQKLYMDLGLEGVDES